MGDRFQVRCSPNPSGRCMCGCGRETSVAGKTGPSGKGYDVKGEPRRFCFGHRVSRTRPLLGGHVDARGYVRVRVVGRGHVKEHVLLAERALGRRLRGTENVHHVNGDQADNRPQNLVVCPDHGYHMLLEARTNAYRACGHADWASCRYCGQWFPRDASRVWIRSPSRNEAYHLDCHAQAERGRRAAA